MDFLIINSLMSHCSDSLRLHILRCVKQCSLCSIKGCNCQWSGVFFCDSTGKRYEMFEMREKGERNVLHPFLLCQVEVVMATRICSCTCCHGWERRSDDVVYEAAGCVCHFKSRMRLRGIFTNYGQHPNWLLCLRLSVWGSCCELWCVDIRAGSDLRDL